MKKKLFNDVMDPGILHDRLESECVDVEDNYEFIKPFSRKDETEENIKLSKSMVSQIRIETRIDQIIAPLKADLKAQKGKTKVAVRNLEQGGITTFGKVYIFPDYSDNLMGIYDPEGNLVGTRPLTREENQLHINSNLNKASNE